MVFSVNDEVLWLFLIPDEILWLFLISHDLLWVFQYWYMTLKMLLVLDKLSHIDRETASYRLSDIWWSHLAFSGYWRDPVAISDSWWSPMAIPDIWWCSLAISALTYDLKDVTCLRGKWSHVDGEKPPLKRLLQPRLFPNCSCKCIDSSALGVLEDQGLSRYSSREYALFLLSDIVLNQWDTRSHIINKMSTIVSSRLYSRLREDIWSEKHIISRQSN